MAYFNQLFGSPSSMLGGPPSASAFTSPGMSPQNLAMLMAMQNQGGAGAAGALGGSMTPPQAGSPPPGGPQLPQIQSQGAGGRAPNVPGGVVQGPNMLQQLLPYLSKLGGLGGLFGGGAGSVGTQAATGLGNGMASGLANGLFGGLGAGLGG